MKSLDFVFFLDDNSKPTKGENLNENHELEGKSRHKLATHINSHLEPS